jgi:4-carboxymuconolactone decarboxylase
MRLPIIPPSGLNAEQQPLYEDMRLGIAANFQGFVNVRDDGALLGPWNPWIQEPKFGKPVWDLTKAMISQPSLPAPVREVAIFVTGSHFRSGYELYAHVIVCGASRPFGRKTSNHRRWPASHGSVTAGGCRI